MFINTQSKIPISGDHILNLLKDKAEDLWIGYYDAGLDLFDTPNKKNNATFASRRQNPRSNQRELGFWRLAQDKSGNIWVGMDDEGVNVISRSKDY